MIWFGSSAGVALSNKYNEIRNTIDYIKKGWHVTLVYIISFFVLLGISGWHPHPSHKESLKTKSHEREMVIQPPSQNNK